MSGIARGPCDEGILASTASQPCDRSAGGWIVAATVLGSSMAFIDGTVVNVALPVLQARLGASVASGQWVVAAYALALSALVLSGGAIGDRWGRRRTFAVGILIFSAASAGCGLAPGIGFLIAARALQGIGAALLVPSSLAILGAAFSPRERGRAVGSWSALTSAAAAIGPVAGGWLVQVSSWRAAFFLNLPIAAAVLAITRWKVPESRDGSSGRPDFGGALLSIFGLGLVVLGLIEAPSAGWQSTRVAGALLAGTACLFAFVAVERASPHPMIRLSLFRSRTFAAANVLTFFLYAAISAAFFVLPFELIQGRGFSPPVAGAAFLPLIGLMFLLSRPAGALADRFGARPLLVAGPAIAAGGFLLLAFLPGEARFAATHLPALCVLGLGMALTVAPLTAAVLNSVDPQRTGAASGINNAVARVAGLLAIAALGIVATGAFNRSLDRRLAQAGMTSVGARFAPAERRKLGAAQMPQGLTDGEKDRVRRAIAGSVTDYFRISMILAAGMAILASCAGAFVGERVEEGPGWNIDRR